MHYFLGEREHRPSWGPHNLSFYIMKIQPILTSIFKQSLSILNETRGSAKLREKKECKNSEYDQEITQSQTADKPTAPQGRDTQQPRDRRKINQAKQAALSSLPR